MDSPCIWMSGGLVRYKLCDRDFDCERCPLDAALRGAPAWREAGPARADERPVPGGFHGGLAFPDDRRYSAGHLWVSGRGGVVRAGVDALAAALLGAPARVCWDEGDGVTLDLPYGAIPLASPVGGRALHPNRALAGRPELVADDPYGEGWLIEVEEPDDAGAQLVDGSVALERAALDLRHFRRRAAMDMLSDTASVGATMADGGQALTDLRRMLGPRRYLALVREIVR